MIEENRLMILSNYAAAFMGNRQVANSNTDEIFEILSKETLYKNKPVFQTKSSGDIDRIILSNNKAKSDLNWSPKISIEEGLKKTSEWFKNNFYK